MKKPPVRMCIACRNAYEKRQMLRIVKRQRRQHFFGLYLEKKREEERIFATARNALKNALKNKLLNRCFERDISAEVYDAIKEQYSRKQD